MPKSEFLSLTFEILVVARLFHSGFRAFFAFKKASDITARNMGIPYNKSIIPAYTVSSIQLEKAIFVPYKYRPKNLVPSI